MKKGIVIKPFRSNLERIIIVFFMMGVLNVCAQNSSEELFEQGNAAYNDGDFTKAISLYVQTLDMGSHSAALYFNMGNAYYRLNNVAESIYYFEKAKQLDPDNEDQIVEAITSVNMAAVSSYGDAEERSSGDAGMFKIRYRYSGSLSDNSRTFCVEMVGLSDSGKVYRKEDINQMSFSGVNGQFSPKGRSTYSIFKYKGGAYCHHKWQRLIYTRKRSGGKFLPKSETEALENDKRVAPSQAAAAGPCPP